MHAFGVAAEEDGPHFAVAGADEEEAGLREGVDGGEELDGEGEAFVLGGDDGPGGVLGDGREGLEVDRIGKAGAELLEEFELVGLDEKAGGGIFLRELPGAGEEGLVGREGGLGDLVVAAVEDADGVGGIDLILGDKFGFAPADAFA